MEPAGVLEDNFHLRGMGSMLVMLVGGQLSLGSHFEDRSHFEVHGGSHEVIR